MRPSSNILTYSGIAVAGIGFALIGFAWSQVAGLTSVPLQLPYLVSGGFTGLGLILVGLLLIDTQTTLRDAARRDQQLMQLQDLMDQIRIQLGGAAHDDATDEIDTAPQATDAETETDRSGGRPISSLVDR